MFKFMKRHTNRPESQVHVMEVVLDALIGALVRKRVLSRDDIQRQIIETAAEDNQKEK